MVRQTRLRSDTLRKQRGPSGGRERAQLELMTERETVGGKKCTGMYAFVWVKNDRRTLDFYLPVGEMQLLRGTHQQLPNHVCSFFL